MSIIHVLGLIISYILQHPLGIAITVFLIVNLISLIKLLHIVLRLLRTGKEILKGIVLPPSGTGKPEPSEAEAHDVRPVSEEGNKNTVLRYDASEQELPESGNIRRWKENMARRRA